jgi:hypothetical protein
MTRIVEKFPVDATEALEACAVMEAWRGRADQLPRHLGERLKAMAALSADDLVCVEVCGGQIVVELKPEVRAIIAVLRALS